MTSREVIRALIRDKQCPERMGVMESFWPDLTPAWEKEGLPAGADLLEYFNLDFRYIGDSWINTEAFVDGKRVVAEDDETYTEQNGWGARMRYWKHKAGTPEHLSFDLTDEANWRRKYREPLLGFDLRRFGDIEKRKADFLRTGASDKFAVYEVLGLFEIMRKAMGDVIMLEAMCLNPAWIHDFCEVLTDNIIRHLDYELQEVGIPDGIWIYEDLGYTQSPFISPKMYETVMLPWHRQLVDFAHSVGLPVILHTCGRILPLFPLLVESGIDCLQPIEAKAGQHVVALAEAASRRIAFMGNLDIRAFESNDPAVLGAEVVPKLTAVREKRIPYVFHSDHSIPKSVRLATYQRALDLFRRYGRY